MNKEVRVAVLRLAHGGGLPLPAYQSAGAAGLDLVAAIPAEEKIVIEPGRRSLIPTGIALAIPEGFEAQVRPRSGLAHRHGVTVLNTPGTIDSDYRGEVLVLLINLGEKSFEIMRGIRIAQLVIAPVARAALVEVAELNKTFRSGGGFGSTGLDSGIERER
jgi:dUTP pyrophosphatase